MTKLITALTIVLLAPAITPGRELFEPRTTGSARASTSDPNWAEGNGDSRPIAAGETLEVAALQGPGIIRHLWFTVASNDHFFPRSLVLRMYWDGSDEPAVQSPLGDFFGVGHAMRRSFDSAMVATSAEGRSYNCYWPMPFREGARITVTNDSDESVVGFFAYVDYETDVTLAEDVPYFHAQYRQETPPPREGRYLVMETTGKGHYVGTVLNTVNRQFSWHGEGDDFFFIDGEAEPSIRGTGTEDYINDAWGFREFANQLYGVTVYDGLAPGDRSSAYRWHTDLPIAFDTSLRFEIEHRGITQNPDGTAGPYGNRPDDVSSVAFWYQTGTATDFAQLPPLSQRVPEHTLIEAESLIDQVTAAGGTIFPQNVASMSGGQQVFFNSNQPGGRVTIPVTSPGEGRYRVSIVTMLARDFGIWDVTAGPRVRRGLDLYHPNFGIMEHDLGVFDLSEGQALPIVFQNVGADHRSEFMESTLPFYQMAIDAIIFYPLPSRFYPLPTPTPEEMRVQ